MQENATGRVIIVLYSGGPDSYITYHWAKRMHGKARVFPLYFDLAHRYSLEESITRKNHRIILLPGSQ